MSAGRIVRPGAHVDGRQRQRRALIGHTQALAGLVFVGDVDHDAQGTVRAVGIGFASGAQLHPAQLAVVAPHAHAQVERAVGRATQPVERDAGDAIAVFGQRVLAQGLAQVHRRSRAVARQQRVHVVVPLGPQRIDGAGPQADPRRLRCRFEPLRQLQRLPAAPLLLADVEGHAEDHRRLALGVAHQQAPRQHRAPAAVAVPVARLRIDRPAAGQRGVERGLHVGQIVRMDPAAHRLRRHPLRADAAADHGLRAFVMEEQAAAQVVPPQADARQRQRQIELRLLGLRARAAFVRGRVIDHDAEHTRRLSALVGHHMPVRVQERHRAVRAQHAKAAVVPARCAERGPHFVGAAIVRVDALGGFEKVRRLARWVAEEAQHVVVPAPFERARIALPDAEAAEVLRHVEQLGQALVLGLQARNLGLRSAQLVVVV